MAEKFKKEQHEATKIAKTILKNPDVQNALDNVVNAKNELAKANNSWAGFGKFFNDSAKSELEITKNTLTAVISQAAIDQGTTKFDEIEKALIKISPKAEMALTPESKKRFAPQGIQASEVVPVRKTKKVDLGKKGIISRAQEEKIKKIREMFGKNSNEYKIALREEKKRTKRL